MDSEKDIIGEKLMAFMRENYNLDEVGDEKNFKFRQGKKTILTVAKQDGNYNLLVIFGKAEREIFERERGRFSDFASGYYDRSKTYHDGKWMFIEVKTEEQLDEVLEMVKIKKKPKKSQ